ncbi:MAG: trypsin-like peptidase domain-containing protein [Dehalococcoidia bacterium]|nr:trypsin-like peptidase domain-containing protein [Dehalococcoidia bacterium]
MTTPETGLLTQLSDAMAAAVERAGRSTVLVNARRRLPASGIAWAADGLVVTSDHVIEREDDITIGLPGGEEVAATIAGRDPGSDVAVLRASGATLDPAARGGELRTGHFVLAVGRPQPGEPMASFGVVSAVGGPWRTFRGGQVDGYIRSDTTLFPGFSGGPLVNAAGEVAGMNSSRLGRGAGLTIPVAALATVVDALLAGGRIRRGYLGIGSQQARLPEALAAKAGGQATGLLVVGVEPGSPADAAGLLVGDILVALAGSPTPDTDDLQQLLGPQAVGQATPARILRGGEPRDITITIGERG